MDFIAFVLLRGIIKQDNSNQNQFGYKSQVEAVFTEASLRLKDFLRFQEGKTNIELIQFAPYAVWFEVLYEILWTLKKKNIDFSQLKVNQSVMNGLIKSSFDILIVYKTNSKFYTTNNQSHQSNQQISSDNQQLPTQTKITKLAKLFSEILDLITSFLTAYMTSVPQEETQDCIKLYEILIRNQDEQSFTQVERLTMLSEMNFLFQKITQIWNDDAYWQTISSGLQDIDQASRKISINILKSNLKMFQEQKGIKLNSLSSFQQIWETFFEVFDALESFGTQQIKAVWPRVKQFYDFIVKFEKSYQTYKQVKLEPLEDMRMWLIVIYKRIGLHNNMKVRKFVQKATLKREFITPHMTEFFFNEFLSWLNECHIFKDAQNFPKFSKNADSVIHFYTNYFEKESRDLPLDLSNFFEGFSKNKLQNQMTLICLKTLVSDFSRQLKWIGSKEITILQDLIDIQFNDQMSSIRYLCLKYVIRLVHNNLKLEFEEWSSLFILFGSLPLEFFSTKTNFDDQEARKLTCGIITQMDTLIKTSICEYLNDLFTVKAMSKEIPKFSKNANIVLSGIIRLLICFEDLSWLNETLAISLEAIESCLQSTYLQPKLVEQKIQYFVQFSVSLYQNGSIASKNLAFKIIKPRIGILLSRFWDLLCVPLSRGNELLISEMDRVSAVVANLKTYSDLVFFAIQIIHLDEGSQDNALEAIIKKILTTTVMLTQKQNQQRQSWSVDLLQLSVFEVLQSILKSYSQGIKQNIKTKQSQIFIQEELFTIGRVVLQNLMDFKVNRQVIDIKSLSKDQEKFLNEIDYNPSKIQDINDLNAWKILSFFISIFQFDAQLRQELQTVYNTQITQKCLNFIDSVSTEYNPHLFQILNSSFVPQIVNNFTKTERYDTIIEDYQQVVRKCWVLLKQNNSEMQPEQIVEYFQLSFNIDILEVYQKLPKSELGRLQKFHQDLAEEVIEFGTKQWLILRQFFNHMMFMFASKPHLMSGFETFICKFGTTRECSSLDNEIKFYKLSTMIPQAISKKYENIAMEEITYKGAYIRTMTLIIMEGIIKNYLTAKKSIDSSQDSNLKQVEDSLIEILLHLLKQNLDKKQMLKSDQPFSESHRIKLRTWQMIIIMQNIINDSDVKQSQKTLSDINDLLWPILQINHLQNIRQYIEIFTIKFVMKYPELTLNEDSLFYATCLQTKSNKAQLSASLLVIAGIVLLHTDPKSCIGFKRKIFEKLVGYCGSNSAHCRSIAQYFIIKLNETEPGLIGQALQPIMKYMAEAKDVQKMMSKYQETLNQILYKCLKLDGAQQILQDQIGCEGEFIGINLIEELIRRTTDVICDENQSNNLQQDGNYKWQSQIEDRKLQENLNLSILQDSSNLQRKISTWDQVEFDQTLQKRVFFQRKRNEIILCAVLIDKLPNLAGLARTSEIMNANSLLISNSAVCQIEEFKEISVTSEKCLPIYEVKERDLLEYLQYQKSNGFKIVGIEQTANSKMLHQFKFPSRCVLLLGKEKEGIPQEYYSVLDFCVEIPQFGIIRSLNVHVSGALAMWEYSKQNMPEPAPSTQTNR